MRACTPGQYSRVGWNQTPAPRMKTSAYQPHRILIVLKILHLAEGQGIKNRFVERLWRRKWHG